MRKFLSTLILVWICSVGVFAQTALLEKLRQIPQISDIEKKNVDFFDEYYEFWFEQPVDHAHPEGRTFKQKVLLGHRNFDAPVIVELEGYNIWSENAGELATLFKGNQLTIEHRFFDRSVPQGNVPWEHLTIKQAADDQHAIIQSLKENVYPAVKWVSTGISKGGQTTVFHRYFYPEDVDVSVPYVAPLNLEYVDPRLDKFLEKLGTVKNNLMSVFGGGGVQEDCHYRVRDFQNLCFEHKNELFPLFKEYVEQKGYTYRLAGGVERAYDLVVLEYPFSFWQWGNSCEEIPDEEYGDWEEIADYLVRISSPDFFDDKYLERMRPFFYAALTETGMYDYKVKPIKKYLKEEKNIDFSFSLPADIPVKPFNAAQMQAIQKWLQTDAEKILFVYGGSDPWYGTGVDLKKNSKCRKYVRGDMSHTCRIKDFDPVSKEDLIDTLKEWLAEP